MLGQLFVKDWRSRFKFRFFSSFLAGLLAVLWIGSPLFAFSPPSNSEIRGVWLTSNDTATIIDQPKLQEAIDQLTRLNFNTIYPVVWNSGYALFPSTIAQQAGIQPFVYRGIQGQDPLAHLIQESHRKGLLVIPWFEFGFMAPPTSELALKYQNLLTQRRDGSKLVNSAAGEVVWLNPFHPKVQQFIGSLVLELMDRYDVDGIQFDDHLSLPHELGYDPYTIALYKQETGKLPPANSQDKEWVSWRSQKLTDFVTRLNQAIKARKPQAIFSISPNPYDTAYKSFLQDWLDWVRKDLVDELIVQVYRPELSSFISQVTRPEIQEVRQKIPTGVGILTGLRNRPTEMPLIRDKVLAARRYGLGFSFFFYDSLWNYAPEPAAERQASFQSLFSFPAIRARRESPQPLLEETKF